MLNPTLLNSISTAMGPATLADWLWGHFYPEANSNHVEYVDFSFDYINWVTLISFVGIVVVMVYFAVRYRRHAGAEHAPHTTHHNTALEIGWSVPPLIIVILMFYFGFTDYLKMTTPPADAYEIRVTARKWAWTFRHPNGWEDVNLHVPAGKPIVLRLESQDVIHSLYVPAFRVKKDVVPGRYTTLWFNAIRPTPGADYTIPEGAALDPIVKEMVYAQTAARMREEAKKNNQPEPTEQAINQQAEVDFVLTPYPKRVEMAQEKFEAEALLQGHQLFCTEFCGEQHSMMLAKVVVHPSDWQAPPPLLITEPDLAYGEKLFSLKGCISCHQLNPDGPPLPGPTFAGGIFGKEQEVMIAGTLTKIAVDEDYIRESIRNPNAKIAKSPTQGYLPVSPMPQLPLNDVEIESLLLYIKSLSE